MINPPVTQADFRSRVVTELRSYWTQSNTAKKDVDVVHDRVIESYNGVLPKKVRESKAIQTKTHLGWTARAVDAFTSRLSPLLMPSPTDYFSLYDTSQKYALSCSVMTSLIGYFMTTANIMGLMDRITDTLALEGAIGLQPRWDYCYGTDTLPDLQINVINPQDINVYPVTEPVKRAIMMVRTYLTKQELLDMAETDPTQSYDGQAISELKEGQVFSRPIPSTSTNRTDTYNQRLGMEVVDYYAPALKIDDQMFYHVRATIVQGTTLIRFVSKDDPYSPTSAGSIFACLNELYVQRIGPVRVGVGLCNKAIDLEMAAITVHNLGVDNIKDTVKPPRTYDPTDKYWNQNRSGFAPGELVASISTNPRHLMPVDSSQRAVPQAEEMISRLMYQYESAVGIPNFLSGTSDTDDRRVSATAKRLEANGADAGLRKHAANINARALEPATIEIYNMIRTRIGAELQLVVSQAQEMQATGQLSPELLDQLVSSQPFLNQAKATCPDFDDWFRSGQGIPPISSVRLKLSTFEDALQKVDQVNNSERIFGNLTPLAQSSPEMAASIAAQVDVNALIRTYVTSLDMAGVLRPISQVQDALQKQAEARDAEQQQNVAAQAAQLQLEADKVRAETEKTLVEADKARAEIQKIQAETLQTIEETTNPKEPTSDGKSKGANTGTAKSSK